MDYAIAWFLGLITPLVVYVVWLMFKSLWDQITLWRLIRARMFRLEEENRRMRKEFGYQIEGSLTRRE